MDGWTDGRTDGQTQAIALSPSLDAVGKSSVASHKLFFTQLINVLGPTHTANKCHQYRI